MTAKFGLALSLMATGLSLDAQAAGKPYHLVHSFQANGNTSDGAGPSGLMAFFKGTLYGTTQAGGASGNGTVFKLNPRTGVESVVYAFKGGSDGYTPARDLAQHDGILYGTTAFGGQPPGDTHGFVENGTIFSIDTKTGVKTTLFEFPNDGSLGYSPGDVLYVNGVLYGITAGTGYPEGPTYNGTLFSYDLKTGVLTTLRQFDPGDRLDAAFPLGGLIDVKGTLYGTSREGGNGSGTIFSYKIHSGEFKVLLSLGVTAHYPTQPESTPVYLDGALYVTSMSGGTDPNNPYGLGTVFKFDLATSATTILYSFQGGNDGGLPQGGLVYENGLLYGTTVYYGRNGGGTVFSIDPEGAALTTLYSFGAAPDASEPIPALTDVKGTLFGTSFYGGTENVGAVFKYKP